jgi:hypothetical protein
MPNKLGRTPEKEHKIDAAQIIFSIAATAAPRLLHVLNCRALYNQMAKCNKEEFDQLKSAIIVIYACAAAHILSAYCMPVRRQIGKQDK